MIFPRFATFCHSLKFLLALIFFPQYAFASGRYPGGAPDRYTQSEGDAQGVIRGGYAYLDPNHQWQKVEYVADENGFHVDTSVNPVAHPRVRIKI